MGVIAVVRAHFQHSGDAGPAANTLQSYLLPFGFAIRKHPLEVLDPFFYRRHRVDLLPFISFCGYASHPGPEKVWKMGKLKSNSTGKEGCLDTPCMRLVNAHGLLWSRRPSFRTLRCYGIGIIGLKGEPWGSLSYPLLDRCVIMM